MLHGTFEYCQMCKLAVVRLQNLFCVILVWNVKVIISDKSKILVAQDWDNGKNKDAENDNGTSKDNCQYRGKSGIL